VEWFDFKSDEGFHADPHHRLEELRRKRTVFFTPFSRGLTGLGTWVFTRGKDLRAILQDPETFASSGIRPFGKAIGDTWSLIPIDVDPPMHAKYRQILNPLFSPASIKPLEEAIAGRASELTAPLRESSGCEFMESFARPFPVSIFLELFGLPIAEMWHLVELNKQIIGGAPDRQVVAIKTLRDYLRGELASRRAAPRNDIISQIIRASVDGRSFNDDELMGLSFTLFLAGLDTVTSTLSYVFRYLAEHPIQQGRLREDQELVPHAVEELLRSFNVITTGRRATRDVDFGGVHIKEGDNIALPVSLISRDPEEFADPDTVDFDRSPNRHAAFGNGIHRCLGSHLARRELLAAVREWTTHMPPYVLSPSSAPRSSGASVVSLNELRLSWSKQ